MSDVEALLDAVTARLRPLEIAANEAWWLASTAVSDEHERRRVSTDIALRDALGDVATFGQVRDALAAGPVDGDDPLTRRQLEVLYDRTLPHQVPSDLRAQLVELEAEVDGTFNAFRGRIDGEPVDDNTIATDPAHQRRQRRAPPGLGSVEAGRGRGRRAGPGARPAPQPRRPPPGRRDHFALALATSELDETRLFETLDEVERATTAPFADWKAELDDALAAALRLLGRRAAARGTTTTRSSRSHRSPDR